MCNSDVLRYECAFHLLVCVLHHGQNSRRKRKHLSETLHRNPLYSCVKATLISFLPFVIVFYVTIEHV